MRVEKQSANEERRIVMGMIVDDVVCGKISEKWERGLFKSKWAELVAKWCVTYYGKYGKSPKHHIESVFESWANKRPDDESTIKMVEKLLGLINGEYEQMQEELNSDYLVDLARDHFNVVKLERLADSIKGSLDVSDSEAALESVISYGKIEIGQGAGCDILADHNALEEALSETKDQLVKFPQALQHFFEDAFTRDSFVSIMAPEKRGKTFWLIDIAWRAVLQNRKVAFFAVGDMSQKQMIKRFASRAAKWPIKASVQKIPVSMMRDREAYAEPEIDYKVKKFKQGLSYAKALQAMKKFGKRKNMLKLSTHPNSSISVRGIDSILQQWERDGWVADMVVIDYADILDMSSGGNETRHQVDKAWREMRALSQRRHCCVVTATQADAASYDANLLTMSNFSEDKRKMAHVTGMFGLNQTAEEKQAGVYRLNWIVLRESEFDTTNVVYTVGNLALTSPVIHSCF